MKKKKDKSKEAPKKRLFKYKSFKDDDKPESDSRYHPEAYELFQSIRWDNAWNEFISLDKNGKFKFSSSWSFCKYLVGHNGSRKSKETREKAKWLYAAIGPIDKSKKRILVPYISDWAEMRSSQFIGETNKESLLYNPKIVAVRELISKHLDVMEISQGIGTIMADWLARFDMMATQIDEYYKYKLFDPKLSDKRNDERFHSYTKKQEYIFGKTIDASRQVLRCFGVGENDVALLTQMMIAAMRNRLGEGTTNIMMAAATGTPLENIGGSSITALPGDQQVAEGSKYLLETNPALKTMFGTFLAKSKSFGMSHPDVVIDGVAEEKYDDDKFKNLSKVKANGKANGKSKEIQ